MKVLQNILYKVGLTAVHGSLDIEVNKIVFDSREVEKDAVFVAIKGTQVDGHLFIEKAIDLGATVIVCEILPIKMKEEITYVQVKSSHQALALLGANFYDNPSAELKLIGVTGTNGKTTTVTLLHSLLSSLGFHCGLLSTVVNLISRVLQIFPTITWIITRLLKRISMLRKSFLIN